MTTQDCRSSDDDLKAVEITEILDGIPGAWERAQESIEQGRHGDTVSLSDLVDPPVVFGNR
jgi:hypothetical protein